MQKMPCLFVREFHGRDRFTLTPEVTPGCEWVLAGEGVATLKWDGTACMVRDGVLYKRYDAKKDKRTGAYKSPPASAIPCCDPDPVTGHWPHWVPVDASKPEDKWHTLAWNALTVPLKDGTYELIGPALQGNPHKVERHEFKRHGDTWIGLETGDTFFRAIHETLLRIDGEGIVFHHKDGRMCKIRRADFRLDWPLVTASAE